MKTKLAVFASLAIFSLIAITPSSFAADPYVSGSIVTSDEYPPWDRYIDVNGLRILGLQASMVVMQYLMNLWKRLQGQYSCC